VIYGINGLAAKRRGEQQSKDPKRKLVSLSRWLFGVAQEM
jgi:hypothetical protein